MKYELKGGKLHLVVKPKKAPPPQSDLRPMQNSYEGPAFGGEKQSNFYSDSRGPLDLRGASDWVQIASYETGEYKIGTVNAEAMVSQPEQGDDPGPVNFENDTHAEIRVIGYIAGNAFILTQAAIAHRMNLPDSFSPGHFRHVITEGQMPDRLDLQARARRGGEPETADDSGLAGETMMLSTWVRFQK